MKGDDDFAIGVLCVDTYGEVSGNVLRSARAIFSYARSYRCMSTKITLVVAVAGNCMQVVGAREDLMTFGCKLKMKKTEVNAS